MQPCSEFIRIFFLNGELGNYSSSFAVASWMRPVNTSSWTLPGVLITPFLRPYFRQAWTISLRLCRHDQAALKARPFCPHRNILWFSFPSGDWLGRLSGWAELWGVVLLCLAFPRWSARATVTKYRGLGALNDRNLVSHCFGGYRSKVKLPAGLVLSAGRGGEYSPYHSFRFWWLAGNRGHSLACGCKTPFFTWRPPVSPPCSPLCCPCVHSPPFHKDVSHTGLESTLMASFSFDCLHKDPISK